jgi:alkylated DNA repair dioxygenase AlkB
MNINGLTIIKNFISNKEELELINNIKNINSWNNNLSRRVKHYGFEYNYINKTITDEVDKFPKFQEYINKRMIELNIINEPFNQLIINEYIPGNGISKHIDSNIFDNIICSLSLHDEYPIIFRNNNIFKRIYLPRKSLLIIKDDARYKWTHEIPSRKKDNNKIRLTRWSLTYRHIKI